MARVAPWLALFAAYVVAVLTVDVAQPSVQAPRLLDALDWEIARYVLAASAALAFAAAAGLARTWVPEPWATRAALLGAVSPAGFALSNTTAAPAAALLTTGLLLAVRTRDHPTRLRALGGAGCLALAPWFGVAFAAPAALALLALVYWTYRRGRRLYAFLGLEFAGATVVTLAGIEVTRGVLPAPGVDGVLEVAAFAPPVLLAIATGVLLLRSRREHVSRAIPARRDAEVAAGLAWVVLTALAVAAALAPIGPEAGVPIAAALAAWALRALPRTGVAVALATIATSAAILVALLTHNAANWLY